MRFIGYTITVIIFLVSLAAVPLWALSLEEAKAKGLVGERANGYLGVVNAADREAQALAQEINQKRRQAYEEIAKKNGTQLNAVETLAGEKAIQNTRPGQFVEGPGGWVKK
ncbi:YdbL family protein [Nitrospira moscoviensis]|uniref:DUF1318 domain-containing protein n=1 Tax=Nitrospira moscoviensis TaxID=42253 RepID=A0A0K2G9B1_NITMO|nr:YdbL family protein [Nitrospira moscoviensis]ALA57439.1 conserved exported protein of unknown function [Nitrospira moscoviensis]